MPFAVDAVVLVTSVGRTGVVVEAGRGGRYRVRVGGVVMSCREEDLRQAGDDTRAKRKREGGGAPGGHHDDPRDLRNLPTVSAFDEPRQALATIDLHGLTVQEALEAVERRLDAALRGGIDRLDIVHGLGSGRIKSAVHRYLREVGAVRRFEVAPGNPGVTRVFF